MKARLILVGGFLGAGKTSLLWETARRLTEKGQKFGLITNDQAPELVDTAFLERAGETVLEVSGSCFCCNFGGLADAVKTAVAEKECEIIIAEPVGSCTDLSATILQPLKHQFSESFSVAPLTVLVDPEKLSELLNGGTAGLHKSAAYILRKQLEEADLILINKSDLLKQPELEGLKQAAEIEWPLARVSAISAKTGEGLTEWLDEVLTSQNAGTHLAEVDYDTYAEGEAVLGWFNASLKLKGRAADWNGFLKALIERYSRRFDQMGASVGHVKMLLKSSESMAVANLTGKSETIRVRGNAGAEEEAALTVNARVEMEPEVLKSIVFEELNGLCGDEILYETLAANCLSPGRPNPTYRYDHTV